MNAREGFSNTPAPQRQHSLIARLSPNEIIEGAYRVHDMTLRKRANGFRFWEIVLSDRTGEIQAFHRADGCGVSRTIVSDQLVFTSFRTRLHEGRLVANIIDLDNLGEFPDPMLALDRLPRIRAYRPEYLDKLHDLIGEFRDPILREALERLIMEDRLMLNLIERGDDLFAKTVLAASIAPMLVLPSARNIESEDTAKIICFMRSVSLLRLKGEKAGKPSYDMNAWRAQRTLDRCGHIIAWLRMKNHRGAGWLASGFNSFGSWIKDHNDMAIRWAVLDAEKCVGLDKCDNWVSQ